MVICVFVSHSNNHHTKIGLLDFEHGLLPLSFHNLFHQVDNSSDGVVFLVVVVCTKDYPGVPAGWSPYDTPVFVRECDSDSLSPEKLTSRITLCVLRPQHYPSPLTAKSEFMIFIP